MHLKYKKKQTKELAQANTNIKPQNPDLNPVHTTYGAVIIEHVDLYGSAHTQTQHAAQIELCPLTTTVSSI